MKFEDHTTRHLEATLDKNDTANTLADDLISNGLINEVFLDFFEIIFGVFEVFEVFSQLYRSTEKI